MSRYQKINEGRYRKGEDNIYKAGRTFTQLDFMMGITAVFVLFIIGIRHFDDWGKVNILEGFFALFGIIGLDYFKSREFNFGKPYKKFDFYTLPRFSVILISVVMIQVLSRIPFTIENIELALTIIFASIAEEIFFRGVLITLFLEIDKKIRPLDPKKIVNIPLFGKTNLNIRVFGIVGIFMSSLFFAGIHTNYYGNPAMLLSVFLGGLVFGFFYYIWEDLLAVILAHFLLNVIAVGQSGLLVNLSGTFNNIIFILVFVISFICLFIFVYIFKKHKKIE